MTGSIRHRHRIHGRVFIGFTSGFTLNQLVVLDSDGDGRDDFMVPHSSGTWHLFRSTGVGATSSNTSIPVSSGWVGATAGDFNGDGSTDVGYSSGGTWVYRMHQDPYPDLLTSATDGFGNSCTFEYKPLTAADYTKLATASFPQQDYIGSLYVVTKYTESNGIGGTYDLESFHYEGARRDLQGRGFLGFAFRSWIDDRDSTVQRRTYQQDFPFVGFVTNAKRTQASGTVISEVAAVPAAHSDGAVTEARSLPFTSQVTRTEREVDGPYNGNLVRTIVQNNSVDSATGVTYDTTTTVTEPASGSANGVQAGGSYVQRTYQPTASFLNDWTNWCFGRPQEVQQINSHNQVGGGAITRTFEHHVGCLEAAGRRRPRPSRATRSCR